MTLFVCGGIRQLSKVVTRKGGDSVQSVIEMERSVCVKGRIGMVGGYVLMLCPIMNVARKTITTQQSKSGGKNNHVAG